MHDDIPVHGRHGTLQKHEDSIPESDVDGVAKRSSRAHSLGPEAKCDPSIDPQLLAYHKFRSQKLPRHGGDPAQRFSQQRSRFRSIVNERKTTKKNLKRKQTRIRFVTSEEATSYSSYKSDVTLNCTYRIETHARRVFELTVQSSREFIAFFERSWRNSRSRAKKQGSYRTKAIIPHRS